MIDDKFAEFLKQNQFVSCDTYSIPEKGMGSKVDAFCAGDILLRVVVDRGQRFIELAFANAVNWVDVFALVSKIDINYPIKRGSFTEAVEVLRKYWPEIITVVRNI